ncbi:hypothetical protein [Aquimarina celericrescens]|uniref:Lipoprotein n=1 Tax=Aquimarina celericrescens TaxID=1964542 RepID=A0ABW5AT22_9FLAO|nr:hypothetical protein [Aquimarina celericrescens]
MNKIVYIILISVLFSCKSNSAAQEKEKTNTDKPKVEKPKFGDVDTNNQIEPGTVYLTGSVVGVFKDKEICGKSYKATTVIKVNEVTGSGSGIVNLISSGQEITFGFLRGNVEDFKTLQQKFTKDQQVFFIVRESLCPDMNGTVYEIIRFNSQ